MLGGIVVFSQADTPTVAVSVFLRSFLASVARCTIYTAVYKDQQVVVKLMRKDVQDAALVRDELELELALLRRSVQLLHVLQRHGWFEAVASNGSHFAAP